MPSGLTFVICCGVAKHIVFDQIVKLHAGNGSGLAEQYRKRLTAANVLDIVERVHRALSDKWAISDASLDRMQASTTPTLRILHESWDR